jgi:hypothetical protein
VARVAHKAVAGKAARDVVPAVIQLISGGKLDTKATGKVVAVEEKDGHKIAVIEITARLAGKGTGEELGLPQAGMGGFGGRAGGGQGGRGQGGGAATGVGTDKVDASFQLTGKVRVDLTAQMVAAVELGGNLTIARAQSRTMDRGGEEMKIDTQSDTKGSFQLKAACEPAGR